MRSNGDSPRKPDPEPERTPGPNPARPDSPGPRRLLIEDWVGAIVIAVLAAITFANVLARYFTDQSFAWTEELSIALMVVLTLVAASAAVYRDRHIRIEFLFDSGSKSRRRCLAMLSSAATVLAYLCLAGLGVRLAYDDFQYEVTSPGIGLPQWWYTVWLPLVCAVIAARAMQRLISQAAEIGQGRRE